MYPRVADYDMMGDQLHNCNPVRHGFVLISKHILACGWKKHINLFFAYSLSRFAGQQQWRCASKKTFTFVSQLKYSV